MRNARVCPSYNNWHGPSCGWKGRKTSFPGINGFGFDEWLTSNVVTNTFPWMKRGLPYYIGFVQAFKSQKPSFVTDVDLFVIDSKMNRLKIGEIKNCRRLTSNEARALHTLFQNTGVLANMQAQLLAAAPTYPDLAAQPPEEVINVAYAQSDISFQANATPVGHTYKRYNTLYF